MINSYTFDPKKQKVVKIGKIISGVLYKNVLPKHFMRIVNGYGIQYDAFNELKVSKIIIIEENGNKWESKPSDWKINGKIMDFNSGKQIFLSLKYMHLVKNLDEQVNLNPQALTGMAETKGWDDLGKKLHSK